MIRWGIARAPGASMALAANTASPYGSATDRGSNSRRCGKVSEGYYE